MEATLLLTSSVNATGEKTAREPLRSFIRVARPPILRRPKRRKGTERVEMVGVRSRITITLEGSEGMSFLEDWDVVILGGGVR